MNRPSHWILGFLAALGGLLWWTGALPEYLSARPSSDEVAQRPAPAPVVVRRDAAPPRPTNGEVSGRVIGRDGFPVEQARVRVFTAGRAADEAESATTDERGRFRLTVSGATHRRLRIEAPGRHAPAIVQGSPDELDVVLQDAVPWTEAAPAAAGVPTAAVGLLFGEGWIRGVDGRRVANARVTVRETGASERSDENGRYLIPLDGGPCTLVAFDGTGGVAVSETQLPPRLQGKVPLPDLQLAQGPTIRGRLINRDGDPLVDAAVLVETGGVRRATRTEQGGLFSVAGLVAGDCELIVLPFRGHLGARIPLLVERDANLPDIRVQRPLQEPVRLQVVDETGAAQAFVHVVADQLAGLCRAYAQADGEGRVALRGLGEGDIDFEVRDLAYVPVTVAGFDAGRRILIVAR
jgi:hypothetical protein